MGAARKLSLEPAKLDLFPEEAFIQEALKVGRASRQDLNMKAIGKPDVSLQARVKHLDRDHVRRLGQILLDSGSLAPVVVFYDSKTKKCLLADGFHRHEACRIAGKESIPAIVVKGTRADAVAYAAMCNRVVSLKRTKDDERKAICMLLDERSWFKKKDKEIAAHVGVTDSLVSKVRVEYCQEKELPIPAITKYAKGRLPNTTIRNGFKTPGVAWEEKIDGKVQLKTLHKGKEVILPPDRKEAAQVAKKLAEEEARESRMAAVFYDWAKAVLKTNGIEWETIRSQFGWSGACVSRDDGKGSLQALKIPSKNWLVLGDSLSSDPDILALVGAAVIIYRENALQGFRVVLVVNGDAERLQHRLSGAGITVYSQDGFTKALKSKVDF